MSPPIGKRRRAVSTTSPYAPIIALNPDLLVPLLYASTAADGQILFEDTPPTVAVSSNGDPVGGVRWDGVTVADQGTDANRPVWQGPANGAVFDGQNDVFEAGSPGDLDTIHQNGGSVIVSFRMDTRPDGVVYDIARNNFSTAESGFGIYWDNRDPGGTRPMDHAVTFYVSDGSGSSVYRTDTKVDDGQYHTACMTFDSSGFKSGIDGTFTDTRQAAMLGGGAAVEPLLVGAYPGARYADVSIRYVAVIPQVIDETKFGEIHQI